MRQETSAGHTLVSIVDASLSASGAFFDTPPGAAHVGVHPDGFADTGRQPPSTSAVEQLAGTRCSSAAPWRTAHRPSEARRSERS